MIKNTKPRRTFRRYIYLERSMIPAPLEKKVSGCQGVYRPPHPVRIVGGDHKNIFQFLTRRLYERTI